MVCEYDVDPDEATADDLAEATELIERLVKPREGRTPEPASLIRRLDRLNRLLAGLDERGIGFFVGPYWEPAVTLEDEPSPAKEPHYCRVEPVCRGLLRTGHARGRYRGRFITLNDTDERIDRSVEELRRYGWVVEDLRSTALPVAAN